MEWFTVSTMKGQKGQIQWFRQWQRSMYQVSQAEIIHTSILKVIISKVIWDSIIGIQVFLEEGNIQ